MPDTLADIQAKAGTDIEFMYKGEPPYMEEENGIGYKGTLSVEKNTGKIQCGECGKWFTGLCGHLRLHKMTAREYKDKHGLYQKDALVSRKTSALMSKNTYQKYDKGLLHPLRQEAITIAREKIKELKNKGSYVNYKQKMQFKNEKALCDDQIQGRLDVVLEMSKKSELELTMNDVLHFDKPLYYSLLSRFGSTQAVNDKFKFKEGRHIKYNEAKLFAELRLFVLNNGFIPKTRDLTPKNGLTSRRVYTNHFGSWERTKALAGLHEILAQVKEETKQGSLKPIFLQEVQ